MVRRNRLRRIGLVTPVRGPGITRTRGIRMAMMIMRRGGCCCYCPMLVDLVVFVDLDGGGSVVLVIAHCGCWVLETSMSCVIDFRVV